MRSTNARQPRNGLFAFCKSKENPVVLKAQAFIQELDALEKIPVKFGDETITAEQKKNFAVYLKNAIAIKEELAVAASAAAKQEANNLSRRIIGLKYRIEKVHGGYDREQVADSDSYSLLEAAVQSWKEKQPLYKSKQLTDDDRKKIEEMSHYYEFVTLLIQDKKLQDDFFKWSIRDNNGVRQFIEFPATMTRVNKAFLDKRVGLLDADELSVQRQESKECKGVKEKVICLPFYDGENVNRISILDESKEVILNNKRSISIKNILDIFKRKNKEPGSVEYFKRHGIVNWHNYELGPWNDETKSYDTIDFQDPQWWNQLFEAEELTKEEVEKRCGLKLISGEWVQSLAATREAKDDTFFKRHGYTVIYIPQTNGNYRVYPIGLLPESFPEHLVEQVVSVPSTVRGRISYIDENYYYSQREQAFHSEIISAEKGLQLMDEIKHDIQEGLKGNRVFQFAGQNCADWAGHKFANKEHSDVFTMQVQEMDSHSLLKWLVKAQMFADAHPYWPIKKAESGLQFCVFALLLGLANCYGMKVTQDGKEKFVRTLFESGNGRLGQVLLSQPSQLFHLIEQGKLSGQIRFGTQRLIVSDSEFKDNAPLSTASHRM